EDGVRLADPVGGVPEAERVIQTRFQTELVRHLDPLRVVDREIRVAGVAAAAEYVFPADRRRPARPVHAGAEARVAGGDAAVRVAGGKFGEERGGHGIAEAELRGQAQVARAAVAEPPRVEPAVAE